MSVDPFDMSVHHDVFIHKKDVAQTEPIRKVSEDAEEQTAYEEAVKSSREARDRRDETD